jgi:hypothetical protein
MKFPLSELGQFLMYVAFAVAALWYVASLSAYLHRAEQRMAHEMRTSAQELEDHRKALQEHDARMAEHLRQMRALPQQ